MYLCKRKFLFILETVEGGKKTVLEILAILTCKFVQGLFQECCMRFVGDVFNSAHLLDQLLPTSDELDTPPLLPQALTLFKNLTWKEENQDAIAGV